MRYIVMALIGLVAGFAGAALWSVSGLGDARTRTYLVENPEILPEVAQALQQREAQAALASIRDEVTTPFPGAVLGNPNGTKTLVKFTDYACGYCRASVPDVERLIAEDPDLKVVIREWPIFEGSEITARMALAAARQGKYDQFHKAMFAAGGREEALDQVIGQTGLDEEMTPGLARSDAVTQELARNMEMARTLGFTGTPSWIANGRVIQGAVGYDALKDALDAETAG